MWNGPSGKEKLKDLPYKNKYLPGQVDSDKLQYQSKETKRLESARQDYLPMIQEVMGPETLEPQGTLSSLVWCVFLSNRQ
jgi:hypothetical protein